MVRLIAALALSAGCTVSVSFDGTVFTCERGPCPSGLECIDGVCTTGVEPPAGQRRRISIDHSAGAAVLVDFPYPIRIDASLAADIAADGADLRFTDADGNAIAHEIERWDAGGESMLWVGVPLIEPLAVGAELFMIYGEPGATDSQDPALVWGDFHAVYHLTDAADSTASALDGQDMGATTVEGVAALARHFDGAGQYVDLGRDRPFARAQSLLTLSAWAKLDAGTIGSGVVFGSSIDNGGVPTNSSRLQILVNPLRELEGDVRTLDGGPTIGVIGPVLGLGVWQYLSLVVDLGNGTITLLIDGVEVAADAPGTLGPQTADSVSTQTVIGFGESFSVDPFFGDIDEVRLSHRLRDADWIAATARSMRDRLVTIGPAEPIE